jgi:hypothetical protein
MVELIIIKKYLYEFHNGALLTIERRGQEYVFSLESAEMDRSDMKDGLSLSERGTIKGKLHLEIVQSIKINELIFRDELKMKYDYGSIFDFDIQKNVVELQISWRNVPQKPYINDFSTIVIKAKNIWWENIPDLADPFW